MNQVVERCAAAADGPSGQWAKPQETPHQRTVLHKMVRPKTQPETKS